MTSGGAIGGREFLTDLFESHKTYFGQRRSASSYPIKGGEHAWRGVRAINTVRFV